MNDGSQSPRRLLAHARRVVVKIGSRVLVQKTGKPDIRCMRALVKDLAAVCRGGREVVVVSSGAISAGMESLGLVTRPANLPDLQMAAALGQVRLMARYEALFAREHLKVGQVLLTHGDLKDRRRHLNARNTMMNLLRHQIVPIVNENDVVAVDEIKFGDNDMLASLVAHLIQADLLILLTVVNGLRAPLASGRTRRVSIIQDLTQDIRGLASGTTSQLSVGGMATKLQSAEEVVKAGAMAVIANGREAGIVGRTLAGEDVGTLLVPPSRSGVKGLSGRQRWIAFFHRAQGSVIVDDGARQAILTKGRSLLPIGIRAVEGRFGAGDVVSIKDLAGAVVARGLALYSSDEVALIQGRKTSEIEGILGARDYDEVVHRDDMVILTPENASSATN